MIQFLYYVTLKDSLVSKEEFTIYDISIVYLALVQDGLQIVFYFIKIQNDLFIYLFILGKMIFLNAPKMLYIFCLFVLLFISKFVYFS